ncbi:MAG: acyl CoA:acetate/3-ketoacid CoA transferase, partial [Proteobacteria bacterium]|nr:acyl CoA:acetate/3-ketoacid CoA transferase [Pseudomonadota bacterium]
RGILREGRAGKFVREVEHRTVSGRYAWRRRQAVLYVTERCVFQLCDEGLELIEIAPGVDLQKDILDHMEFVPVMKRPPLLMDPRIFRDEPMGLRRDMLDIPLERRLSYDPQQNLFFVNFEGLSVRSEGDILRIMRAVDTALAPVGHKVDAIVNYDRFSITPELVDDYIGMVKGLMDRHYNAVTRYTASTFLRMKLGEALEKHAIAPRIYERADEAEGGLRGGG